MVVPCLFSSSASAFGRLPSELRTSPIHGKENEVGRAKSPRKAIFNIFVECLDSGVRLRLHELWRGGPLMELVDLQLDC